jgi:hypothetical protein
MTSNEQLAERLRIIRETTPAEPDWQKQARLDEVMTEEMFGYQPRRPRYFHDNYAGQEADETARDNFNANRSTEN